MRKKIRLVVIGAGMVLGGFASAGQASAAGLTPVTIDGVDAMHHVDFPPALCHADVTVPLVQVPVQQVLDSRTPDRCTSGQAS